MHNRFKAMVMLLVVMRVLDLHAAMPAARSIDPASLLAKLAIIEDAIPLLQAKIRQVRAENQNDLSKHVASSYSPKSNQTLSDATDDVLTALDNFNYGWTCVLTNYAQDKQLRPRPVAAPSKEADGKKHHDAHAKQQGKGSPQVPHLPSVAVSKAAQMYGMQEQKAKVEGAELQVGTDTIKLYSDHPNYAWAMRISYKVKKLAELSLDHTKLAAFASAKKRVFGMDDAVLGIFSINSEGKLQKFVDYLKALRTDKSKEKYFKSFHVDSIADNAQNAATNLDKGQADRLILFLDELIQGIPA